MTIVPRFSRIASLGLAFGIIGSFENAGVIGAVEPDCQSITYPDETLPDTACGELSLKAARGKVATVLVSLSVECPISNEFVPTLNRLADRYHEQGVNFIAINPNTGESLAAMAQYDRDARFAFSFVKDATGKVSQHLGFQVTPEVRLFDASGTLVYRGGIDDRYTPRGTAAAPSADLARAIDELLANKPVRVSHTRAMGCPIN